MIAFSPSQTLNRAASTVEGSFVITRQTWLMPSALTCSRLFIPKWTNLVTYALDLTISTFRANACNSVNCILGQLGLLKFIPVFRLRNLKFRSSEDSEPHWGFRVWVWIRQKGLYRTSTLDLRRVFPYAEYAYQSDLFVVSQSK